LLYIYAIVDRAPKPLGRGLAGESLQAVKSAGVTLIVGDVDAAPSVTPENLKAHDRVASRLARRARAVLPARFGWVVGDEKEIASGLSSHRADIAESLRVVSGCVQMNLRLFGQSPSQPDPHLHPRLIAPSEGERSSGTQYLRARAQALRDAETLPELGPLRARLAGLLRAQREERLGTGDLVGTAYHLIARGRLRTYRSRVQSAAAELAPLRVRVSGPWAPYAFGPAGLR
jgi:hypothetical protein